MRLDWRLDKAPLCLGDIFRHVGMVDMGSDGAQAMMQCPPYWPDGTTWVPIRDLEILEILEDQDVRAG